MRNAAINMGKIAYLDKIEKLLKWLESTIPSGIGIYRCSAYDDSGVLNIEKNH